MTNLIQMIIIGLCLLLLTVTSTSGKELIIKDLCLAYNEERYTPPRLGKQLENGLRKRFEFINLKSFSKQILTRRHFF